MAVVTYPVGKFSAQRNSIMRISILLALFTALFSGSFAEAARTLYHNCHVIINETTIMNGRCLKGPPPAEDTTTAAFEVQNDGYVVEVDLYAYGKAIGFWNGSKGGGSLSAQIGPLDKVNGCWINQNAEICVWKSEEIAPAGSPPELAA